MTVIMLLSLSFAGSAELSDGPGFEWNGTLEKLDKVIGPGSGGEPVQVMYDKDGTNLLLWGHEHEDDLRVLGNDLSTKGVLELPFEDFSVEGAVMSFTGSWVFAWGRTPSNDTDLLVSYNITTNTLDRGFIPPDTVALEEIDTVNLLGADRILAVAGRDANGTSRVVLVEVIPKVELTNHTVPDNRTVVAISHDGIYMILVLDDGGVVVYSTDHWTFDTHYQVFDGAFTAYEVKPESDWHFGSDDGDVVGMTYRGNFSFLNLTTTGGPVVALYSMHYFGHLVVATSGMGTGTMLEVWDIGISGHKAQSSMHIEGTVTSIAGDPNTNGTFAVCLSDGSVEFYEVVMVKNYFPPREPTWGDKYGKPVGISGTILLVLLVIVLIRWWRRAKES
jgi:hypothetical protein